MTKIRIVQIALSIATDPVNGYEEYSEYLDDQGRVWYRVTQGKDTAGNYITKWVQLDLPEEPEEPTPPSNKSHYICYGPSYEDDSKLDGASV